MRVYMKHVRQAYMCSGGARTFFEKHNLDWTKFLREGIDAEELIKTNDAMALKVVEVARNG